MPAMRTLGGPGANTTQIGVQVIGSCMWTCTSRSERSLLLSLQPQNAASRTSLRGAIALHMQLQKRGFFCVLLVLPCTSIRIGLGSWVRARMWSSSGAGTSGSGHPACCDLAQMAEEKHCRLECLWHRSVPKRLLGATA